MQLSERYADQLVEFREEASRQIAHQVRRDNYGVLRSFEISEDEQGVWIEVTVDLHGEVVARWGSEVYTRRELAITTEYGHFDDASFGAALLSTAVMEDLDTCGRRQP